MAEYERSATVRAPADALFAFLSDVRNLPRYFSRMVAAGPGRGAEVQTEAVLPDGTQVAGRAPGGERRGHQALLALRKAYRSAAFSGVFQRR